MDQGILDKIKKTLRWKKLEVPGFEIMDVRDFMAPPSIQVGSDYLQIGDIYARTFFVFSYPRYLSTGWFSPVINLETPMDISFFIHPADTSKIMKDLRQRITAVKAEMMTRQEQGFIRSPKLEHAYRNMEALRDQLQTAQERMFSLGLYMTIYAKDMDKLRELETTLRAILEGRLIYIKPAVYQQSDAFISTSPYGLDKLLVHTPMNTAPLSSVFPFISFDLSSNQGILYGINQHNNSLVLFDRFSMESYNETIFGVSGCGKSVDYDTAVLAQTKKGVEKTKIGELIDSLFEKKRSLRIDKEIEGIIEPGLQVFTFDKDLKGRWERVSVAARKKAPKTLYNIKTKSGREITTTGDHNFVILKNGRLTVCRGESVRRGDYVPLPREMTLENKDIKSLDLLSFLRHSERIYVLRAEKIIDRYYKKLKDAEIDSNLDNYLYRYRQGTRIPLHYFWKIISFLKIDLAATELKNIRITSQNGTVQAKRTLHLTSGFFKLLGLITAEATINNNFVQISNNNPEILKWAEEALDKHGFPCFHNKDGFNIGIGARVPVEIFKKIIGTYNAGEKRVPGLIFNASQKQIAAYLSGYFAGDGTVGSGREASVTSKSKSLISDISYLLNSFGIIARIRKKFKRATNSQHKGAVYWQIVISGQKDLEIFHRKIGFALLSKQKELEACLNKKYNTNVDIIPGTEHLLQEIYKALYSSPQIRCPRIFNAVRRGDFRPSRESLKTIIRATKERIREIEHEKKRIGHLKQLPGWQKFVEKSGNRESDNHILWQELSSSWYTMKKEIPPMATNMFRALNAVNGTNYKLSLVKQDIFDSFKNTGLSLREFDNNLWAAIKIKRGDTSYQRIWKAAQFLENQYQEIVQKIEGVKQKLRWLETLASSDLFWDPIAEIKKVKNEKEYVYDLQVNNGVFLAGHGGLFVHNSFMIKLEILRSLMKGMEVIVLDPENEYEFLSDAVGGSFLSMSLSSPYHINPFDLPKPREDEDPENVLRSNIINLVGLMRIMLGGMTPEEDAIMDRALTITYEARDITPESDPSTWEKNIPLMEDLESVLETMEGAEGLVRRIRKYTKGTYASFFNQHTNISMDKEFVVFGIRDMEEQLKQLAMFIIMRYVWKEITSELKKRIMVIDEAWWMMQTEDGASFLYGLVKRARKYWLGVTTITQDVDDFMRSKYGQPIVANSAIQILMKQSSSTMDTVKKTFNLTEEEKMRLLEASVGEGLFFAGAKHVAINVVASYTEDQIITTAPEEVVKIRQAKKLLKQGGGGGN